MFCDHLIIKFCLKCTFCFIYFPGGKNPVFSVTIKHVTSAKNKDSVRLSATHLYTQPPSPFPKISKGENTSTG